MFLPRTEQNGLRKRRGEAEGELLDLEQAMRHCQGYWRRGRITFTRNIRRNDSTHVPKNEPLDIQILEKVALAKWVPADLITSPALNYLGLKLQGKFKDPAQFSSDVGNIVRSSWLVALGRLIYVMLSFCFEKVP